MNLECPLKNLPRILPEYYKVLEKLGLFSVQDLLFYFPFRYDDFSQKILLDQKYLGQIITVEGKITKVKLVRIFKRRMTILEAVLQDENNTPLKIAWFNQPFLATSIKENSVLRVSGKLSMDGKFFSMSSPSWERADREATNTGRLVPVYNETKGITSKWLRWQIQMLLKNVPIIPEVLPEETRKKFHLPEIKTALSQIHFPDSPKNLLLAQKRFAFENMFLAQIKALQTKNLWEKNNSCPIKFDEKLIKNFVRKLPFKLTNAQRKASFEILKDLEKNRPMNRLLNGDVGSGKTIVAAIAALQAIAAGYQVALMAPTEILARQHFENFCKLFKDYDFNIVLLTNSYKTICHPGLDPGSRIMDSGSEAGMTAKENRNSLLRKIKSGEINLVIGTHALIQKDIKFNNLALVVIDEQHRFGVAQRAALQQETMNIADGQNKTIPHLLTMTATPIPRTLAIAFFGSLSLSLLDEMPKNRKPIITKIIPPEVRNSTYKFVRKEIKNGRQVFIVLPLIEESESLTELKAAKKEHERLSKEIFPELKLGLLHGKLKSEEKEKVMSDFAQKKLDILVSTPVVEVGIDIPNATIMLIENAERFGLAQLHQFRGRVGRGEHQSYCFLFAETDSERIKTLEKTADGFQIAEKDLELRGPGQFFGTIQSGLPDIVMKNLGNLKLIKFAREEAKELLQKDRQLKSHPAIRTALQKFQEKIHLE